MKKRLFLCFIALLVINIFPAYGVNNESDKQVVIIIIDGLRSDIIKKAYTPGLYKLLQSASYSLDTNTVSPSITLPAHLSLVSGLTPANHGVKTNNFEDEIKNFKSNTVFSTASSNGLRSGIIVGKEKLKLLKAGSSDTRFEVVRKREDNIKLTENAALKYLNKAKPNLLLIHFPEPDRTGHKYYWLSEEYYKKVEEVDKSVYSLVKKIEEINSDNDYLIIITADHGGIGKNHKINNEKVQKIPLIILGNSVKKNNRLKNEINIYDISPTIYDYLGFSIPSGLDGKIINDIYID